MLYGIHDKLQILIFVYSLVDIYFTVQYSEEMIIQEYSTIVVYMKVQIYCCFITKNVVHINSKMS